MKTLQYNHVTTEVTRYEIDLTDELLNEIKRNDLDIKNEDHQDEIFSLIRDYSYDNWIDKGSDIVDGHFQDEEILNND